MFQVCYVFPPPALIPLVLSKFQGEHIASQFKLLILVALCWMASLISQHVVKHSSLVSHHKGFYHGCFSGLSAQGTTIAAFNALVVQRCVFCKQRFSSSVWQVAAGAALASTTKVYQQCWKEWASWCAWEGVPDNAISALNLLIFWLIYLGWDWLGIPLAYIIQLFQLFL